MHRRDDPTAGGILAGAVNAVIFIWKILKSNRKISAFTELITKTQVISKIPRSSIFRDTLIVFTIGLWQVILTVGKWKIGLTPEFVIGVPAQAGDTINWRNFTQSVGDKFIGDILAAVILYFCINPADISKNAPVWSESIGANDKSR